MCLELVRAKQHAVPELQGPEWLRCVFFMQVQFKSVWWYELMRAASTDMIKALRWSLRWRKLFFLQFCAHTNYFLFLKNVFIACVCSNTSLEVQLATLTGLPGLSSLPNALELYRCGRLKLALFLWTLLTTDCHQAALSSCRSLNHWQRNS